MRLTSFTDFGMRMLMRMAAEPERPFSSAELALELGLSRHHLAKIIQKLAEAGLVETRRGTGGGALLARPPHEISLDAIVRLLEADQHVVECFGPKDSACTLLAQCRLKARLQAAEEAFLAELSHTTLADVALAPGA